MRASGKYTIINELGLHARAAAQLVQIANRYPCEVFLTCDGQRVNGKSIMGVLMLAAAKGMELEVECNGEQSEPCLEAIVVLINNRFGESK